MTPDNWIMRFPFGVDLLITFLISWGGVALLIVAIILLFAMPLLRQGASSTFDVSKGSPSSRKVSEKIYVKINGVRQGMFIESNDASNPVLLYLHGGLPEYFLTQKYPTGIEADLTIVWPEQLGSRLSFDPSANP